MTDSLAVATIIIYIILIQPTVYCLWRHGWPGFLGWFYLQVLCVVRIVGNALDLQAGTSATSTSNLKILILSSIGLSPLLLATTGILHEARLARNPSPRLGRKFEWCVVIKYHFFVSGALGVLIAGIVFLQSGKHFSTAATLLKLGAALLVICWALVVVWAGLSVITGDQDQTSPAYADGTKLLPGVFVALPLLLLRLIYGIVSLLLLLYHPTSAFLSSVAAKACLSVVPEMLIVIGFVFVGIRTRNIPTAFWSRKRV
ncbi:MAG: hypothetical protein M1838_003970 [Thelocarpon superellum]|nr:MAG: hypothetical protein M1838_003970 [Thelocarpon superellum]